MTLRVLSDKRNEKVWEKEAAERQRIRDGWAMLEAAGYTRDDLEQIEQVWFYEGLERDGYRTEEAPNAQKP